MLTFLSLVAIAAQSMTAALAAGRRSMDWFGVCVLACVTALGGGTVRNMMLGHYPLYWVGNPYVLLLASGAALLTIALAQFVDRLRWPFLLLDALGLVVFTIIGCNVAMQLGSHPIIVLVSGMATGIVGGVLRDVLCNDVPLVFRSELYAGVSLATAALYFLGLKAGLNAELVSVGAASFGFAFRVAALIWHWNMPKFIYDKHLR